MKVHVANSSITHAPTLDLGDEKAVKTAERHGVEVKTINPGDHFDPAAAGLSDSDVKRMVARGDIREVKEDEEAPKEGEVKKPPMTVRGNETEGSGATRRGEFQNTPPGIDERAGEKGQEEKAPEPVRTGVVRPGSAGPAGSAAFGTK